MVGLMVGLAEPGSQRVRRLAVTTLLSRIWLIFPGGGSALLPGWGIMAEFFSTIACAMMVFLGQNL